MNETDGLWTRCTEALRDQVSEATWQMWLSGIRPISLNDGVLVLGVPNAVVRERVESRFLPLIEDTLANEAGSAVTARLRVEERPDKTSSVSL